MESCPGDADREFTADLKDRHVTGLVRGAGDRVAILSHQSRGTPCDLAGLAALLDEAGYRVVSWTADEGLDVTALRLLVLRERDRGARRVVLVGASAGGARSLVAAGSIKPAVDAVVALSPPSRDLVADDVPDSVARYRGPLMVVAGEGDTAFADVPAELAPLHDGPEDIRTIAGTSQHGKDFVLRTTDPFGAEVVSFLAQHVD
jgi:dienelactone hydrolase